MSHFINQHSYVLVALGVLGLAWIGIGRLHGLLRWVALAVTLAVLLASALWLRTSGNDVGSPTELDAVLARGRPVALEFFSNF